MQLRKVRFLGKNRPSKDVLRGPWVSPRHPRLAPDQGSRPAPVGLNLLDSLGPGLAQSGPATSHSLFPLLLVKVHG